MAAPSIAPTHDPRPACHHCGETTDFYCDFCGALTCLGCREEIGDYRACEECPDAECEL